MKINAELEKNVLFVLKDLEDLKAQESLMYQVLTDLWTLVQAKSHSSFWKAQFLAGCLRLNSDEWMELHPVIRTFMLEEFVDPEYPWKNIPLCIRCYRDLPNLKGLEYPELTFLQFCGFMRILAHQGSIPTAIYYSDIGSKDTLFVVYPYILIGIETDGNAHS